MVGRPRGLGPPGRALRTRSGLGGSDFTILGEMERSEQGSDVSAGSPYLNHAPHHGRGGQREQKWGVQGGGCCRNPGERRWGPPRDIWEDSEWLARGH